MRSELAARYPSDLWQCVVGRNFGAFATHEEGKFIYFYIGQTGFLVFAA